MDRRTRKNARNQNAVSEVMGEIMMVVVAVVAFTILTAAILSIQTPQSTPRTDVAAWADTNEDTVNIQHGGGEAIDLNNLAIVLEINMNRNTLNSSNIISLLGKQYWELGDVIAVNTSSLWGLPINGNDTVNLLLIYEDTVLSTGAILGAGSTGMPVSTPTPLPTLTPTPTPTPPPVITGTIYTDSVGAGWSLSSQNTVLFNDTSRSRTGTTSLQVDFAALGWVRFSGVFDTTGYSVLEFYINGQPPGGETFEIFASNATTSFTPVSLTAYVTGGSVDGDINTWQLVTIPLGDLGAADQSITGITFREDQNKNQKWYYIDDMYIK